MKAGVYIGVCDADMFKTSWFSMVAHRIDDTLIIDNIKSIPIHIGSRMFMAVSMLITKPVIEDEVPFYVGILDTYPLLDGHQFDIMQSRCAFRYMGVSE